MLVWQLTQSSVDFFAGRGLQYFNEHKDKRNLLEELNKQNFSDDTTTMVEFSTIASKEKTAYILAKDAIPKISEGRGNFLPNALDLSIELNQAYLLVELMTR